MEKKIEVPSTNEKESTKGHAWKCTYCGVKVYLPCSGQIRKYEKKKFIPSSSCIIAMMKDEKS